MEKRDRNYSLDFIKIIATIFIVFHHYQQVTGAWFENKINFYGGKFYFGYIVELFFVLSGYFMYTYIEKIQEGMSFHMFYLKRITRFFGVLLLAAVSYEIFLVIYNRLYNEQWFGINTTFWGIIISSLGIQEGWVFPNPCVNNPTWYISVLMLCYVIFFFLVYLSKRIDVPSNYLFIFMILLGVGIMTYNINMPFCNTMSARGFYSFFFGILLSELTYKKSINNKIATVCLCILVVIPLLIAYRTSFMNFGINYIMTFIYYPALILFVNLDIVKKILNHKIIGTLGKISFDVYIWHNPFFILMYIIIKLFDLNLELNNIITMIGFVVVCYIFGAISYFLIEKPFNRFFDRKKIYY